jgi:APA family basic amino acid/polyamine antiporter
MVTSMMVNFLLMCITLLSIRKVNPTLAQHIAVLKNRKLQLVIGWLGVITLISFLSIHLYKDLTAQTEAWYFHSTPIWLIVMAMASLVFGYKWRKLTQQKTDLSKQFLELPEE